MVQREDIEALLRTGAWKTRSRSPKSYDRVPLPSHAHQTDARTPRKVEPVARIKLPPRPCVEDEEESLAKEHVGSVISTSSDEEPKYRGDIDQQPIFVPVHEHNPERRFVIVDNPDTGGAPVSDHYEANTCRKYVIVPTDEDGKGGDGGDKKKAPELQKRKSHQDLPRLDTHFQADNTPTRRPSTRRQHDKPIVDQDSRERQSARPPPDDAFLSPVPHTAGGRDQPYHDYGGRRPSRSPSTRDDPRVIKSDSRRTEYPPDRPVSPALHRRTSSTVSNGKLETQPPQRPRSSTGVAAAPGFVPDDIYDFMSPGGGAELTTSRRGRNGDSPPGGKRGSKSPPYPTKSMMPGRSPPRGPRRPRDQEEYSSDDGRKERRGYRSERAYPPRTTLEPEYGPRSRPGEVSPSRSSTFPPEKVKALNGRPVSPSPPVSSSPPRRSESRTVPVPVPIPIPLHSRDASISNASNGTGSLGSFGRGNIPIERKPSPLPSLARQESVEPKSPVLYWQPGRGEQRTAEDAHITSIRRYSEDVANGIRPELPHCRWKHPALPDSRPGGDQFMALKRAENFTVCPDCFKAVFANTEYEKLFVPAPRIEQAIACDFGSSPWYRMAYLMTLKQNYPDLRLLQNIAAVEGRHQPCGGGQWATRIWYSVINPVSRRPISSFHACLSCAKMVEALLPNLAGTFVPIDSHSEPTRGICDLHFSPHRKRFFAYFDLFEKTSDMALGARTAPDVQTLADRIRILSLVPECWRNTPIIDRKWHVMKGVPDFTVCEECFDEVVWPMLEDPGSGELPRYFFKDRILREEASCQLYSKRMREVFAKACRREDIDYLRDKVKQRMDVETEIKERYAALLREDQSDPGVQWEMADLVKQLKENE